MKKAGRSARREKGYSRAEDAGFSGRSKFLF
jgi:hypothetical protein